MTSNLVYCRDCGEMIKAAAEICPKCGCRQNHHNVAVSAQNPTIQNIIQNTNSQTGPMLRRYRAKSRGVTALLAIFLGTFGIHRFYLGQMLGILYLLTCVTGLPTVVSIIEGLYFLCMSDDEFDSTHNMRYM